MERGAGREPGHAGRLQLVEHALRREAGRHDHAAAGEQRGERGRHQAVDVEQRHGRERPVVGTEPVVRRDRLRRGHQVAVQERDLLGAAGGAARVQEQGDVVRLGRLEVARRAHEPPADVHAGRAPVLDEQLADIEPGAGRRARRGGLAGRQQHEPRAQVLQEEGVLVVRVGRVQRRGRRPEHDHGQKGLEQHRPVGHDEHHAVAPLHPGGPQDAGHLAHGLREAAEVEAQPVGDVERRRVRGTAADQRRERLVAHERSNSRLAPRPRSGSRRSRCRRLPARARSTRGPPPAQARSVRALPGTLLPMYQESTFG